MPEHHDHEHHHAHHVHFDTPEVAARTEREGEVLADFVTRGAAALAAQAGRLGLDVRRVLDLGSGPGVGTGVLAEQFPAASVVAADGSAAMLDRVRARGERLGFADRLEVRRVELPDGLAELEETDLVWASMALHHVGDELDALRRIAALVPGGLLGLAEHADPLRLEVGGSDPDLWARLDAATAAWFGEMRASLPGAATSDDHRAMVEAAGYEVLVDEVLDLRLDAPLDGPARRFAREHLMAVQERLVAEAAPLDLDAVAEVAATIEGRDDVAIVANRRLLVARAALRPGATPG